MCLAAQTVNWLVTVGNEKRFRFIFSFFSFMYSLAHHFTRNQTNDPLFKARWNEARWKIVITGTWRITTKNIFIAIVSITPRGGRGVGSRFTSMMIQPTGYSTRTKKWYELHEQLNSINSSVRSIKNFIEWSGRSIGGKVTPVVFRMFLLWVACLHSVWCDGRPWQSRGFMCLLHFDSI